jgi:hypothetical protein
MVVDLAVHGQHLSAVRAIERLSAALRVDDGEALVGQNATAVHVDATPVRSAVTEAL